MSEIADIFRSKTRENPIAIISEKDLKNNYISKEKIKQILIKNEHTNPYSEACLDDILELLEENQANQSQ